MQWQIACTQLSCQEINGLALNIRIQAAMNLLQERSPPMMAQLVLKALVELLSLVLAL
jgi:hypothetical protein